MYMNLYISIHQNIRDRGGRSRSSQNFGMRLIVALFFRFCFARNLKNCPNDVPFAVYNGGRCMKKFEVEISKSGYTYRKCSIFYEP